MTKATVLQSAGPVLAKRWQADGAIADYDQARKFKVREVQVPDIEALHRLVERLQYEERRCIIRGTHPNPQPDELVLRNLDTFEDRPSRLLVVDIDAFTPTANVIEDPEAAVSEAIATLPKCLQEATAVYQLSGSCGHPSKGNSLRCHLYYLLADPLSCAALEAWAQRYLPGTDTTVHRPVQVTYTSNPVLAEGLRDPLAGRRVGMLAGFEECVLIPEDMPVPDVSSVRRVTRSEWDGLVDPRAKPGVIGALCRAFSPTELPELFPEVVEASRKPERMTWVAGGGSKEGLRVSDTGTHIYNSHATSPVSHAVNLWDFIRTHVFGHLDAGMDPDALAMDPTAAPSYQATRDWALTRAEVQAQLAGPEAEAARVQAREVKAERAESEAEAKESRMDNLLRLIEQAPNILKLEHDLGKRVAEAASFSPTERELVAVAMQKRTVALGQRLPIALVRKWVTPVTPNAGPVFPHCTEEGNPMATIENVQALMASLGWSVKYNLLTKRTELVGMEVKATRDNYDEVVLAKIYSECRRYQMPISKADLKGILLTLADEAAHNPVAEWIASKEWDGHSRFDALLETIELQPGQPRHLAMFKLRKWLLQGVALMFDHGQVQARGVLTLIGPQYEGKSRWFQKLLGPGMDDLVKPGHILDLTSKDSIHQATSRFICELGEVDGTFKRSDNAALKAFLANHEDVYRRPFAAVDSNFQRRTLFAATVNHERFLQDSTGNTRFWTIACLRLFPDHDIDMQQVWAEAYHWWSLGEAHWFDRDEMAEVQQDSEAHAMVDPLKETIQGRWAWIEAQDDAESVMWLQRSATEVLRAIDWPKFDAWTGNRAGAIIQELGGEKVKTRGGYVYTVPVLKDEAAM